MVQSAFEVIHETYKKAQAEKIKEMEKERKELRDPDHSDSESDSPPPPPLREKKQQTVKAANKIIQLRETLKNMLKQTQASEISDKENREKQFEPITQRLDKAEQAVKQTDKDLRKILDLLPISKTFKPKQLTFTPEQPKQLTFTSEEEEDENIKSEDIYLFQIINLVYGQMMKIFISVMKTIKL